MGDETVNKLSQSLLALKQVVVGDPFPSQPQTEPTPDQKHILAINLPTHIALSLKAMGANQHWGVTVCAGVEDLPNQNPDAAADVVLLGIDSKTPMAQKVFGPGGTQTTVVSRSCGGAQFLRNPGRAGAGGCGSGQNVIWLIL